VVDDTEDPTAVCEKHTVVTLTNGGISKIYATSVDDGSNDNCGIDRFEVRRMDTPCGNEEDLEFGEFVEFCCEDVGEPVILVFRVYDLVGRYSDCMVEVTVADKIKPVILSCPASAYLECAQDYNDLNLTGGEPVVEDNCENYTITKKDYGGLGACGTGTISRIWTVTDGAGLTTSCTQYIYVQDNDPLTYDDIIWPVDVKIPGCVESDANPDNTGVPVYPYEQCKDIGVGYSDQVIHDVDVDDACMRILREWKVADWCEQPPYNYITHTQVIEYILSLFVCHLFKQICAIFFKFNFELRHSVKVFIYYKT